MLERLWDHCNRGGLLALVVLTALVMLFWATAFPARAAELQRTAADEWVRQKKAPVPIPDIPDIRPFGYNSTEFRAFADALTPAGRAYFTDSQIKLDLVFPFVYALQFMVLIAVSWEYVAGRCRWEPGRVSKYHRWLFVPALPAVFDWCENGTVILLLYVPAMQLVWVASLFTMLKFVFLLASLGVVGRSVLAAVVARFRCPRTPPRVG